MSPSMDHRWDKVAYMLCMFKCTLSSGYLRYVIKLSNVCPCALKFVNKKLGQDAIDIYWLHKCFIGVWFLYVMVILEIPWYGYC
jgi:hypothetical protein